MNNLAIGGTGEIVGGTGQGGGLTNENGGVLNVTDSAILLNRAIGGDGGGSGLGGGVFNGPSTAFGTTTLTLLGNVVALNQAVGGEGNGTDGPGRGGGLYLTSGGPASAGPWTLVFLNDASTSDDNVFGDLTDL